MSRPRGPTPQGDATKRWIVDAAFQLVVERGFEGFRTRDVAERAGVNVSTLHFHFATKETLIEAIGEKLAGLYAAQHAPAERGRKQRPQATLHGELRDARKNRDERAEVSIVAREIALRSARDPAMRRVIERLNGEWRTQLEGIVRTGQAANELRSDVESADAALLVMLALWGIQAQPALPLADVDRVCTLLERLLGRDNIARTSKTKKGNRS